MEKLIDELVAAAKAHCGVIAGDELMDQDFEAWFGIATPEEKVEAVTEYLVDNT